MNRKTFLLGLMIAFLLISCKKSDITHENDFEKSYKAWLDFKRKSNNNYLYVVNGYNWAGALLQTTLTVSDGRITKRHFKYANTLGLRPDTPQDQLEWTETGIQLNSHQQTSAASIKTLDEIYDIAKNVWLKKRETGKTYFEAKNNGLISSCGFVEENCMDDCFNGIRISKIEPLNPN